MLQGGCRRYVNKRIPAVHGVNKVSAPFQGARFPAPIRTCIESFQKSLDPATAAKRPAICILYSSEDTLFIGSSVRTPSFTTRGTTMFTVKNLSLGFIAFIALLIGGCTGPVVQDGRILTCTVTGTLESGVYGQIGSTYSGVTVSIVGGQEPYEVSFNGQTQTVASNMASFGSISLTGASDYVNVVDAASGYNSLTGTCSLASNQIGTSTLTVTASTYSPIVGQPVILTASSTLGTTGLTYSFAVSSGENIGVNIINNGTSSATLTSCVGGSPITILATAYEVGSSTPVASGTTTLPITFQGTAIAGTTCTTGLPTGVGLTEPSLSPRRQVESLRSVSRF